MLASDIVRDKLQQVISIATKGVMRSQVTLVWVTGNTDHRPTAVHHQCRQQILSVFTTPETFTSKKWTTPRHVKFQEANADDDEANGDRDEPEISNCVEHGNIVAAKVVDTGKFD